MFVCKNKIKIYARFKLSRSLRQEKGKLNLRFFIQIMPKYIDAKEPK